MPSRRAPQTASVAWASSGRAEKKGRLVTCAEDERSKHGAAFDEYGCGDVAQADGEAGHATRHSYLLDALVAAMRSVWGGVVIKEPSNSESYSDYRPDVAAQRYVLFQLT